MSWKRSVVWLPGLAVAVGAAVATAHGLYEVALASRVPGPIAWLYPLITDGLALVAYTATARLQGSAARYAWTVVVVAAGMSGLAQAVFLAGEAGALAAPPWLRFAIGAWPAIAAAVVAHLLYLLAAPEHVQRPDTAGGRSAVPSVQRSAPGVQAAPSGLNSGLHEAAGSGVEPVGEADRSGAPAAINGGCEHVEARDSAERAATAPSPARDRAQEVALAHRAAHREWPTVSELQDTAGVSRGTASAALKALRDDTSGPETTPIALHLISTTTDQHLHDPDSSSSDSQKKSNR
ncbi:hypothetical protein [Pseudonocardia sp. WMMC193]|uniref:hypothetical protein n=1 Tax=Pseudonocardia sp. WMMC193 TaxID=2911965 RepID=UPI001F2CBB67|nr:hypothetical protein [Pseudonocardia sp. WMMC193]MCF7552168.1 hypothetical protein [Pseudonocardia sp. WMMC193]